ncbi:LCP family protein [Corynebacterium pelargi]|uniref:Transcriptional regulator LytR n=1 Tax=Corynebacterium pelargi TaxID=1471400 RepID=A0A410WAF3_9CORY|nr:LCP family protein [Corynebacterium pelargi]QAU52941.1 Transcriptional regulator LytR [Corynebacterium pelargi]GGG75925.1 transcriptional regulator [Corynebacterium pelargi]
MSNNMRRNRDIRPAPQLERKRGQQGPRSLRTVLAVLSVLVLALSGAGYFTVGKLGNTLASAGNLSLGEAKGVKEAADGATDILLVGSDSRSDAQGNALTPEEIEMLHAGDEQNDNTDTIMLIRVPNDGSSATAISIPRDTYIHDEEFGDMKINGVYKAYKDQKRQSLLEEGVTDDRTVEQQATQAGRQGLIREVADLSGVTIDHYAEVGLLGFVLLTDAVGGVEVCLNEPTSDEFSGADFPAGVQTLNGAQALAFVRQRHGLPRGDLDRIVRQQAFMASLVNKVLSTGTLTNPQALNDMANAVERSVVIDEDWDIMSFANQLQNLAGGNVRFNTIPVTSIDGTGTYGESVVTINQDQVRGFFDSLLGDGATSEEQAPKSKVNVYNATTTEGLAGTVAQYVRTQGLSIGETGNEQSRTDSVILAHDKDDEVAKELSEKLGLPVEEDREQPKDAVTVIVGFDYAGPQEEAAAEDEQDADASSTVGEPGADAGEAIVGPEIDAGGEGPRCVN